MIVCARCEEFLFFFSAFCFKLPRCLCRGPTHIIFYKASGQLLPSISIIVLITIDFSQILCEPNYVGSESPCFPSLPVVSSCIVLQHQRMPTSVKTLLQHQFRNIHREILALERLGYENQVTEHKSLYTNQCFYSCLLLSFVVYLFKLYLSGLKRKIH